MMREITRGIIDRYQRTFVMLGGYKHPPLPLVNLGRRAQLQALRDAMAPKQNQLRRMRRRGLTKAKR